MKSMQSWKLALAAMLACAAIAAPAAARERVRWVGAWATAQIVPAGDQITPPEDLADVTLRQIVRVTLGGSQLRVRLSNVHGTAPLAIAAASVAHSADNRTARLDPASLKPLRFDGALAVTIPAGAEVWSDPVGLGVSAGDDLAISLHLPAAPARHTGHPGSRATTHLLHGDHVSDLDLAGARTTPRWLVIAGVDVVNPRGRALVILGDSITDGSGVQPDTNARWPDRLAERMRARKALRHMAVLNAGIGGNRLRLDGIGPNALARFERDVLGQNGVSHLIVLEGVNDLGTLTRDAPATPEAHAALVREAILVLRQIVQRARDRGITAIGATILPYGGSKYYHPDPANEADRAAINGWIRTPGNFDAVIDLDAAMRDPTDPTRLRADYDSGDGLHPSLAGYAAMAAAVPLELLEKR